MANLDNIAEGRWVLDLEGQNVSGLLSSDRVITRKITGLNIKDLSALVEILRQRTSVLNPDDGNKYYSVKDPSVNGVVQEGVWRCVSIKSVEGVHSPGQTTNPAGTIFQTLAYGWATTIDWTEARINQQRFLQDQPTVAPDGTDNKSPNEKYIEIYWPNLSRSHLQAMMESLSATTFTDPVIQDEKRTGEWHNLVVTPSMAKDGSGIISMSLAISKYRLDGFSTWLTHRTENIAYLWGYAKDEAQAVANAWKAKGRSCTFQYSKESGLVDIILRERDFDPLTVASVTASWNCRYKEVADYYFGVSDPTLYPLITTPANGISYDRQLRDNGDGSWDITVITRNVQYRDIAFQNSAIDADATVQTRQQLGLTTQTLEAITSTAGAVLSQRVEVKDDCSKDVVTNKDTGTAQTSYVRTASPAGTSVTTIKTVQTSALGAPSSAVGHIKKNEDKASKYPNRFDTSAQDITPTDQTTTSTDTSKAAVNTKVIHTENSALTPKPATKGTIYRQSGQPTESGKNRTVEEAIVPTDQTAISTDNSKASVNTKTLHTENATDLTVPSITKGTITKQNATPTEAGNQRTLIEVIIPTDQIAVSVDNSKAQVATSTLHTENATDLTAPSITKGTITRQQASPTEAGNQRTMVQVIVPTDQSAVSVDNSKAFVITKTLHTENATDLTTPLIVQGTITRQNAAPTEAGNQRTVEEVLVPTNQTSVSGLESAEQSIISTHDTEKTAEETAVSTDGEIQRVESTPTDAGNFRHTKDVITSKEQTLISGEDSLNALVTRTLIDKDESYSSAAPSATAGTIKRVTASPTEFPNRPNVVEEVIAPKSRTVTEGEADAFKTSLVTLKTQETTAETVPTQTAGLVKYVRNVPTDTGFRTEKTDVTATARTETSRTSVVADDYTEVTDKFHNADSIPNAAAVVGSTVSIDGGMNEFQKYDYIKKVRTAQAPTSAGGGYGWTELGGWYGIGVWRERYYHTISYHATAALAAAVITDGLGWTGSSVTHIGDGLWQAHLVIRDDLLTV